MTAARPEVEIASQPAVPRLLVDLPSRPAAFFSNLRDFLFPRRLPRLELQSAPAPFWPDVFVKRGIPWFSFLESLAYHVVALAVLIGLSRLLALPPQVVAKPTFDQTQVVYYQPSEYLPPLDTRSPETSQTSKADPEFSRQPIISVPPEADNRSQTLVAPPNVRLKHDVAVPNMVAWSDPKKPRLEIPAAPLTPAADIARLTPQMQSAVPAPPTDPSQLNHRRDSFALRDSVVAPPPELSASRSAPALNAPQSAVIAPPPSVEVASNRTLGDLNIGRSAVINAAPQLPVSAQRTLPGGRSSALAGGGPQVVAPPPSLGSSGSAGAPGRAIALSLHPAIGAPPDPPAGNRRGEFASSPTGHAGATGAPGSSGSSGKTGSGAGRKGSSDLPSGLYVGNASTETSRVAGDPSPNPETRPDPPIVATVRPPRVSSAAQLGDPAKLSEAERSVFGERRFYSVTLNMPNFNSAGGSWVIRFAELKQDPRSPTGDLSQPTATRKVDPAYPMQLMRENVRGTVILYAVIHADGSVGNVRILRGIDDRLDHFASDAVAQWKFVPATKNGSPVEVEATFQIPFRPSRVGTNF